MRFQTKRLLSFLTAIFEGGLYSGVLIGWSSLVYSLKVDGYFRDGCEDGNHTTVLSDISSNLTYTSCATGSGACNAQDSKLNSVYTVSAVLVNFSTLLFGYLMDRFGTWRSRFLASVMVTIGSAFMAIATPGKSYLVEVGMYLLSPGGAGFLVTNMQIGRLFPERRALVITIINGLYGTSASVFMFFKIIQGSGVPLQMIFGVYSVLSVTCFLRTFLFMPKTIVPFFENEGNIPDNYNIGITKYHEIKEKNDQNIDEKNEISKSKADESDLWSFKQCFLSLLFFFNVFAFQLQLLRFNYFLSSYNGWLTDLSHRLLESGKLENCDEVNSAISRYTNVLGSVQLCEAFFFGPVVGFIIDGSQKFLAKKNPDLNDKIIRLQANVLSLSLCVVFGVLAALLQCVPVLEIQPLTVVATCFYRAFLMGATANFLNLAFPVKHFGKLYGITRSVGGISTLLAVPIFNFVQSIGNKFEYANIGFAFAVAISSVHAFNVWRTARNRAATYRKEKENDNEILINNNPDKEVSDGFQPVRKEEHLEPACSLRSLNA